jgi:hypothetical protein
MFNDIFENTIFKTWSFGKENYYKYIYQKFAAQESHRVQETPQLRVCHSQNMIKFTFGTQFFNYPVIVTGYCNSFVLLIC